jgi:hypothetical protein
VPKSALHQSLLLVYAVLWGAATPTFGRLRLFAVNSWDNKAPRRLAWGLLLGNAVPIAGLAFLMWLPKVNGFWGVAAGASIGLFPAVLPRLLHAFTASNESVAYYHTQTEAKQVLKAWDEQWFTNLSRSLAWPVRWTTLHDIPEAKANNRSAHLTAAAWIAALPLVALVLVMILGCPN